VSVAENRLLLWFQLLVVAMTLFGTTACERKVDLDPAQEVVVPNVVSLDLDEAKDGLRQVSKDFEVLVDDGKEGRLVINDDNWRVVNQTPKPGSSVPRSSEICLVVLKENEYGRGIRIEDFGCNPDSAPSTVDPAAGLPEEVRRAIINSCNWPAADLASAYGVSAVSIQDIADAVAADFQEQYQYAAKQLCVLYIK